MALLCLYLSKSCCYMQLIGISEGLWRYYSLLKNKSTYKCTQSTLRHVSVCVDVSTLRHLHSCCRSDVHVLRAIHRRFIDSGAWKVFKRACVLACVFDLCLDLVTVSTGLSAPCWQEGFWPCIFIYLFFAYHQYTQSKLCCLRIHAV